MDSLASLFTELAELVFCMCYGPGDRQITLRRDRGQESGMVGGWVHSAIKAFVPLHERCWEVRRICSLVVW